MWGSVDTGMRPLGRLEARRRRMKAGTLLCLRCATATGDDFLFFVLDFCSYVHLLVQLRATEADGF